MPTKTIKQRPSILRGEKVFELNKENKKIFAEFIRKAKKRKYDPHKHSQTVICGSEEFAETSRQTAKVKFKKIMDDFFEQLINGFYQDVQSVASLFFGYPPYRCTIITYKYSTVPKTFFDFSEMIKIAN